LRFFRKDTAAGKTIMHNAFVKFGHKGVLMPFLPAPATLIIMPPSERDQANSRLVVGYNTRIVPGEGRKQARGIRWELAKLIHGACCAQTTACWCSLRCSIV
jgi:hypothetical protein